MINHKRFATYTIFFVLALLISYQIAHCQTPAPETNKPSKWRLLTDPLYDPQASTAWNSMIWASYGAAAFDAYSTSHALSTGRYQEANPLFNLFLDRRDPAPVRRQIITIGFQYGMNILASWGKRQPGQKKWEIAVHYICRGALTGYSVWAGIHNMRGD